MLTKRDLLRSAALTSISLVTAKPMTVSAQTSRPDFFAAKAIAEEGFIYGLPIVMNYAVMYAFVVNRNSGQFKAPFNRDQERTHVFTYKDTAIVTPNSDTPYSTLWLDLRAGADGAIGSGRGPEALLLGACSATATPTTTAISAAAPPAVKPAITWSSGPDWKGETPAGIKKVFRSSTQFSLAAYRTQLFNPDGHATT